VMGCHVLERPRAAVEAIGDKAARVEI
jgi:hypothetical protein